MNTEKVDPFSNPGFRHRLRELKFFQANGDIEDLQLFVKVRLSDAGVPWVAPFCYKVPAEGNLVPAVVFEAFKIKADPSFKVIVRLWKAYGPGRLVLSEFKDGKTAVAKVVEREENPAKEQD